MIAASTERAVRLADLPTVLRRAGVFVAGDVHSGAAFVPDADGPYRYALWRQWHPGPVALVSALNPSRATHDVTDPTLTRLCGFVRRDGFGALWLVNFFALRSTDPRGLFGADDPVGSRNADVCRVLLATGYGSLIAACGAPIAKQLRPTLRVGLAEGPLAIAAATSRAWSGWKCWGTTKEGWPRHPLRLRGDTPLRSWRGALL